MAPARVACSGEGAGEGGGLSCSEEMCCWVDELLAGPLRSAAPPPPPLPTHLTRPTPPFRPPPRVLGGLWPLTRGRVLKPGGAGDSDGLSHDIFYVPQRPYVTLGTLQVGPLPPPFPTHAHTHARITHAPSTPPAPPFFLPSSHSFASRSSSSTPCLSLPRRASQSLS